MRQLAGILLASACFAAQGANAFTFSSPSTRWPDGAFTMRVQIVHPSLGATAPTGFSWNTAFTQAADRWNGLSGGLLALSVVQGVFEDPCDLGDPPGGDGIHGVDFAANVCGDAFGSSVGAVALKSSQPGGLVTEANIIFNQAVNWDVYWGVQRFASIDFRRVAVHEMGHLFGLGHENVLPAIMAPVAGDAEFPQTDDLNGIDALYDLGCPLVADTSLGSWSGSLGVTDCFDTEVGLPLPLLEGLSTGPDPNSFVDLFQLTLPSAATLGVSLSSSEFSPVIQVMDTALSSELASGWGVAGTPASVSKVLAAGSYVVVVRSIFEGSGGGYTLEMVPEPGASELAAAALAALATLGRLRRSSR